MSNKQKIEKFMSKITKLRNKIEAGSYPKSKRAKKLLSHESLRFVEDGDVEFVYLGD